MALDMKFQREDTDQWLIDAVQKTYQSLMPINVLQTPIDQPTWEIGLVRYEKEPVARDFPAPNRFGAQWTNVVTCSHDVAGQACGFNAGSKWINLFVVRLAFPVGVKMQTHPSDLTKPPHINWWLAKRIGIEFWFGFTVKAADIGVIPLKSSGNRFVE